MVAYIMIKDVDENGFADIGVWDETWKDARKINDFFEPARLSPELHRISSQHYGVNMAYKIDGENHQFKKGDIYKIYGNNLSASMYDDGVVLVTATKENNLTHINEYDFGIFLLGHATTEEEAFKIIHHDIRHNPSKDGIYHGKEFVDVNTQIVKAYNERDEALIFAWRGETDNIEYSVIDTKGLKLLYDDEKELSVIEPHTTGLFILKDTHVHESHDWETGQIDDWHLDGILEPVSINQAAEFSNISREDMESKLEEEYPYIYEGDLMDVIHHEVSDSLPKP